MEAKVFECDICEERFVSKRARGNHRRWHNLPEYKEFQHSFKTKISEKLKGRTYSEDTLKKMSESRKGKLTGDKNHNWKGDDVGYHCLHRWIRKYKPKPECCQKCGKKQDYLEIANISGEYKRDVNDYIYLCVRCHKEMDGTLKKFVDGGEKTRFKKGHKNKLRWNKN